jgi:hypothetical protein
VAKVEWDQQRRARLRQQRQQVEENQMRGKQKAFWFDLLFCSVAQVHIGEVSGAQPRCRVVSLLCCRALDQTMRTWALSSKCTSMPIEAVISHQGVPQLPDVNCLWLHLCDCVPGRSGWSVPSIGQHGQCANLWGGDKTGVPLVLDGDARTVHMQRVKEQRLVRLMLKNQRVHIVHIQACVRMWITRRQYLELKRATRYCPVNSLCLICILHLLGLDCMFAETLSLRSNEPR